MNFKSTILCFLFLGSVSCSSDSTDDAVPDEQISALVGNYQLTELLAKKPSTLNGGSITPYNMVEELDCYEASLQLNPDMTFVINQKPILIDIDADNNYVYRCGDINEVNGVWSDNGSTMNIGNETFVVQGNRLILENDENDPLVVYYRIVYTKQ